MTMTENNETPIIKVRGLHKYLGDAHIIKGVDLDVSSNEVVVIMGPSGGGKSTFLRCLNLLEEPSAGSIEILGTKIDAKQSSRQRDKDIQKIRRQAAMIFQTFNLYPHLTILDNITIGAITVKKVPKAQAIAKGEALLDKIGLLARRNDYPTHLAAGEQQQVAIARSLCMEPQVLLIDDPTSSLDPVLIRDLVESLKRLSIEGLSMVIVSNMPYLARNLADLVYLLDGGVWLEIAPPDEIFTNPQKDRTRQFMEQISLKDIDFAA